MFKRRRSPSLFLGLVLIVSLLSVAGVQAGSVRGHSYGHSSGGSHYYGGSHYGGCWYGHGYGYGYGYGYAPYYAGFGYYSGYPAYYGAYPAAAYYAYGPVYSTPSAYIDTDIQPEDTAVFVDGEPVGTVDDFDGFPRFLSVTPGRHQLTFTAEGRSNVTRSIKVPNGALLQLDFTLPKAGDAGKHSSTKTDEEIVIPDPYGGEPAQPQPLAVPEGGEPAPAPQLEVQHTPEPGFMRMTITPGDASVYLDGELLGSAAKIAGLHGEMRIEAGTHKIEAVRPGFHAGSKRILIGEGEHLSIELNLDKVVESTNPPK